MNIEKVIAEALEHGFTLAAPLDIATFDPQQSVRDLCAAGKCKWFGKSWSCPPAKGSVEECENELKEYSCGIIVQSTAELEDEFDFETIMELGDTHKENFKKFTVWLHETYGCKMLPLASDVCNHCEECTYPDTPCRNPEIRMHPIEGYGILVSDLCRKNNVPASHGKDTFTYISCYLFE